MKNTIYIFTILLLALTACEEVIDIDLNEENPFVVIEADLQQGTHHFDVYVRQTKSYFTPGAQPAVNNATVELTNASGEAQKAKAMEAGIYRFENFTAETGAQYALSVTVAGNRYTAQTTVPTQPILDSLKVIFEAGSLFQEDGYNINLHFTDPKGQANYYRILYARNDTFQNTPNDLILFDDQLVDGNLIDFPIFATTFKVGDSVAVDLRAIDAATYNFYSTLSDIIIDMGGGNSAAPGNPLTNIKGGALGYFGAYSSAKASVVVR